MNGNELADVLRWPKGQEYQHEWYAGQQLPKEWWKTNFPYSEAERMGYRLSPEETRRSYERRKREPKTTSEQLADILSSKDFMMLDPKGRASVIQLGQKIKAAETAEARLREKHEAEMLATGKETQLRDRVQAILQSDRVPAQKVTALTMAGIPLSEARKMIWGERAPEEARERPGVAPRPRATPEELAEALRPEKRGVQFRMVGGELVKEPAGIWEREERRLTPEQRIAKRGAELEEDKYYRERITKLEEARRLRNEAIYEERRENIATAMEKEKEADRLEREAREARIKEIDARGRELTTERKEEAEKRREELGAHYEGIRAAARPPTRMEELELEAKETEVKEAEEARLEAKFKPGELHRKYLYALDEAKKKEDAAIYERRRGNILEAMTKDAEAARLEAEARRLMITEVDAAGEKLTAEKKAEQKDRLEKQKEYWENKRKEIKEAIVAEADKEEAKAKERQERIDYIRSLGKEMKTEKQKKEQERLEKIQEKWKETRKTIKDEIEKDEETRRKEEEVRRERIKEVDALGEALANKRYTRKMEKIEYDDEKKKIERDYRDDRDKTKRDFNIKILEKTFNWMKTFGDLGFDNEDFVKIIPRFLRVLDINKEQEEEITEALGLVGKISKLDEEEVVADLETALKEQCVSIDGEVAREGITEEAENKIEWVAFLQFALDEKILGHDQAVNKWKSIVETGWWLGGEKIPFKKLEAKELFKKKMKDVIAKAKTTDIMNVAGKLLGEENQKYAEKIAGQFSKEEGREIELSEGLRTALVGLGDKDSDYITEAYKSLFNTKTGKMTKEPSATDRQRALAFVVGVRDDKRFKGEVPDEREKGLLPVNMTEGEFLEALIQEPKLSRTQKGWLIWKRFEPALWEGLQNEAGLLGHLIMSKSEEGEKDGILDKIERALKGVFKEKPETHWFFKPAEKVLSTVQRWWEGKEETKPTLEGKDIRRDLEHIVKDHPGIKGREAAIYLKEKGWSDDEIRALGGAR